MGVNFVFVKFKNKKKSNIQTFIRCFKSLISKTEFGHFFFPIEYFLQQNQNFTQNETGKKKKKKTKPPNLQHLFVTYGA